MYIYIYCQNSYPLGKHLNVSQWMSGMAPWQRLEWSQAGSLTALCQPVPKTRRSSRSSMLFPSFETLKTQFESQRTNVAGRPQNASKRNRVARWQRLGFFPATPGVGPGNAGVGFYRWFDDPMILDDIPIDPIVILVQSHDA